ncbi:MAG: aspC, partial [Francisellaceae bacterium]|nr:aspC [Francisellaceae bacterium]
IQGAEKLIQKYECLKKLDTVNEKELVNYFKNPSQSNPNEILGFLENKIEEVIKQGEAQGCKEARTIMAQGLNQFYDLNNKTFKINASHILFTIGGVAGLHNIFTILDKRDPEAYIITPFPHYTLYKGYNNKNRLIPIPVMDNKGFRLTKESVVAAFAKAKLENKKINAFLICNPNNPLGGVLSSKELLDLIEILIKEECLIVIDEAYAEMNFIKENVSFLNILKTHWENRTKEEKNTVYSEYLFNKLINRVIILRSATKGFSTAGDRMAILIAFNEKIMRDLVLENEIVGPPAVFLQKAYASAMMDFNQEMRIPGIHDKWMALYYKLQQKYLDKGLKILDIVINDENYKVQGAFYKLINLSCVLGYKILELDILIKMKKVGLILENDSIGTDEEIAYYILFKYHLMIAPLSHFGIDPKKAYLRITCSAGKSFLDNILKILSELVSLVRPENYKGFQDAINKNLSLISSRKKEIDFSPQRPKIPSFIIGVDQIESAFALFLKMYWTKISESSVKAHLIQNEHFEQFYNILKENFISLTKVFVDKILEWFYNSAEHESKLFLDIEKNLDRYFDENIDYFQGIMDSFDFLTKETIKNLTRKLYKNLCSHALKVILYLNFNYQKDFEIFNEVIEDNLACELHFFDLEYNLKSVMEVQATKYLAKREKKTINEEKQKEIIISLIFARIFYEPLPCEQEGNIYLKFFKNFMHENIKKIDLLMISDRIVAQNASVDYGHLQGDEINRMKIATAFNRWFGINQIKAYEIIFVGCKPLAILKRVFPALKVSEQKAEGKIDYSLTGTIFWKPNQSILNSKELSPNHLANFLQYLLSSNIDFIILDEINTNAWFKENTLLNKVVNLFPMLLKKIILISTSVDMFSFRTEPISVLVAFDKDCRAKLLAESLTLHMHAPRSLQSAFANTVEYFMDNTYSDFKNNLRIAHLGRMRKLKLIEGILEKKIYRL